MANLIHWFPDRRGMATGITICGFGGGALISTPVMRYLLEKGRQVPEYLGNASVMFVFQFLLRFAFQDLNE